MRRKRFVAALLACMLLFSCSFIPAAAVEFPDDDMIISRATGRLNHQLPANIITPITQLVSLGKDETITYNCTYTPKFASIDFGYIDSDGVFYYLNCTSGSFSKAFLAGEDGQYTLAIRNNESYVVTVTGTVKY